MLTPSSSVGSGMQLGLGSGGLLGLGSGGRAAARQRETAGQGGWGWAGAAACSRGWAGLGTGALQLAIHGGGAGQIAVDRGGGVDGLTQGSFSGGTQLAVASGSGTLHVAGSGSGGTRPAVASGSVALPVADGIQAFNRLKRPAIATTDGCFQAQGLHVHLSSPPTLPVQPLIKY